MGLGSGFSVRRPPPSNNHCLFDLLLWWLLSWGASVACVSVGMGGNGSGVADVSCGVEVAVDVLATACVLPIGSRRCRFSRWPGLVGVRHCAPLLLTVARFVPSLRSLSSSRRRVCLACLAVLLLACFAVVSRSSEEKRISSAGSKNPRSRTCPCSRYWEITSGGIDAGSCSEPEYHPHASATASFDIRGSRRRKSSTDECACFGNPDG